MKIQLSSGHGPLECALGVGKLFHALEREFGPLQLISQKGAGQAGCYTSLIFTTPSDLTSLIGTVEWICQSPFRPRHKRKNWFIQVQEIRECAQLELTGEIRLERFHCGGKGGQNVNKVETGVRLIHVPTGLTATATEDRTQEGNRKRALAKLRQRIERQNLQAGADQRRQLWQNHWRVERGKPVRVYGGLKFVRLR